MCALTHTCTLSHTHADACTRLHTHGHTCRCVAKSLLVPSSLSHQRNWRFGAAGRYLTTCALFTPPHPGCCWCQGHLLDSALSAPHTVCFPWAGCSPAALRPLNTIQQQLPGRYGSFSPALERGAVPWPRYKGSTTMCYCARVLWRERSNRGPKLDCRGKLCLPAPCCLLGSPAPGMLPEMLHSWGRDIPQNAASLKGEDAPPDTASLGREVL